MIPAAALALTLNFSSCVGDLDVNPINPQQTMEFDNDAVFNKIYASFCLTGQSGPNGNGDIDDVDEGRSGMFRSHGAKVAYSRLLFITVSILRLHFVTSI